MEAGPSSDLKLFMLLLGSRAPGRHVEQHDFFFGIGSGLKDLVPEIKKFWREAGDKIHIDGWREVNVVDGYRVKVVPKNSPTSRGSAKKMFFVNLGGYQENKFEEQHYVVLTVQEDRASASNTARKTLFYKHNQFGTAVSHIDDKYGVDVDDLYEIQDILSPTQKDKYSIELTYENTEMPEDVLHLGYLKLSLLK